VDESIDSDQAGSHGHAVPEPDRASPQRSPNRLFRGCLVLIVAVIVSMAGIWMLFVRIDASLHPQAGPADRAYARQVAQEAADHLGHSPLVTSAPSASSEAATPSDISAHVSISLKDGTSVREAADLLASTHEAALHTKDGTRKITLTVSMSWTLGGTSIAADFDASRATTDIISTTTRDLTPVGEARTIRQGGSSLLGIDYGKVGSPPASLASPSGSRTWKSFTMNGWHVTSTSNAEGQFPTTVPFEQIITAARQASPTGTIELDNGTLSVTGLATDERKGLAPEAAAPVVHTVADCQAAGLTTLQLNNWASTPSNVHDPWLTFTCNNGTWTPHHGGSTGKDEAAILDKAAEL